jgi:zinc protease
MRKRIALAILVAAAALAALEAEPSPIQGLHSWRLENGLEVFAFRNPNVPLARVQITFRCGSIAQTPETAGLFHLYEHLLFKGNSRYPDQASFKAALNALGVAEWNGGTSTEYVTYYFTIPADKLDAGLEFWSYAMRSPLLDPAELEIEKDVVASEIVGYFSDPDHIARSAKDARLFASYPWRRDVTGTEAVVCGATIAQMEAIKNGYYLPNNCAVFVGGDIDPDKALALVRKWFAGWEAGPDPWAATPPAHPALSAPVAIVYPDESMYQGFAYAEASWRGPDVLADPDATFAADVWGLLIENPAGRFKSSVFAAVPGLYQKEYINGYYYTQRDGGQVNFSTYLYQHPSLPSAPERALAFRDAVARELSAMASDASYFADEELALVKTKLEDQNAFLLETADGFIDTLSFWWASAGTAYYYSYVPRMKEVGREEIADYLSRYALSSAALSMVRVNPADHDEALAEAAGFEVIGPDNAFWWATGEGK